MPRLLFVLPAAALLASAQSNEAPVAPTAFLRETTPLNLHNTLPPEQVQEGWISLFDGHTLGGWTPAGSAEWKVIEGTILGESGEFGWLRHNGTFGDFELKLEFRTTADGNSGVYFRALGHGMPHLSGYEVQICDSHSTYKTGSIVNHAAANGAAIRPLEWQTLEIVAAKSRLAVKVDGKPVLSTIDGKTLVGHIGLQLTGNKKVQFRNIRMRPLFLPMTPVSLSRSAPSNFVAQWKGSSGGRPVMKTIVVKGSQMDLWIDGQRSAGANSQDKDEAVKASSSGQARFVELPSRSQ